MSDVDSGDRSSKPPAVDSPMSTDHAPAFAARGAAPSHGSATDPAREPRIKALTCTEPLHALQTNRGRRSWSHVDFYDLGLAAIDLVVDRMGFDTGIGREELEVLLAADARRFAPA